MGSSTATRKVKAMVDALGANAAVAQLSSSYHAMLMSGEFGAQVCSLVGRAWGRWEMTPGFALRKRFRKPTAPRRSAVHGCHFTTTLISTFWFQTAHAFGTI